MEIIILVSAWFLIGWGGFVYWWTQDQDYTAEDILVSLMVSLLGPLSFLVGWYIHSTTRKMVIFKRRGRHSWYMGGDSDNEDFNFWRD